MMLKLAVILFVACVAVQAAKMQKRAATYDDGMDAGVRGEGDLKHRSGLFVGFDAQNGYLKFVAGSSADTEWKFTSDNRWVHMADNKCVHPEGGLANPADNTRLVLQDCAPNDPDRIRFEGLADDQWWNIVHLSSGKCIHPEGGSADGGVYLVIYDECGRADKLDYIFQDENGQMVPLM